MFHLPKLSKWIFLLMRSVSFEKKKIKQVLWYSTLYTAVKADSQNRACYPRGHFSDYYPGTLSLTHWGRVPHICVGNLTIIVSNNGLSPGRRQAIIWTNAGPLETNFSEIFIGIQTFSFGKMHFKMSSAKWRPFCLGLNVLSQVKSLQLAWSSNDLQRLEYMTG